MRVYGEYLVHSQTCGRDLKLGSECLGLIKGTYRCRRVAAKGFTPFCDVILKRVCHEVGETNDSKCACSKSQFPTISRKKILASFLKSGFQTGPGFKNPVPDLKDS